MIAKGFKYPASEVPVILGSQEENLIRNHAYLLLSLVLTITLHLGWGGRRGYQELPSNGGEGAGRNEGPANVSAHLRDSGVPQGVEVVPPYYQPTRSSPSACAKGSDTSSDLLNPNLSI